MIPGKKPAGMRPPARGSEATVGSSEVKCKTPRLGLPVPVCRGVKEGAHETLAGAVFKVCQEEWPGSRAEGKSRERMPGRTVSEVAGAEAGAGDGWRGGFVLW